MKGYVWFLDTIVTIDVDMMERMENEIANMSGQHWPIYVLSCKWNDDRNCVEFFPDGPWEC